MHGSVRGDGGAIEGAMVVLLSSGSSVEQQLTDSAGTFRIPVPTPGRYALRVDRIGYGSTHVDPFEVGAGASVRKDIQVSVEAVELAGLSVSGRGRCETDPSAGAATATLWEEARKALEAARWTSDREMYEFAWIRHVRDLDASGTRIHGEDRVRRRSYAPRPFESLHADSLTEHGFVRDTGTEVVYYAPDADVLLSDAFLETHCFEVREESESSEGVLGLAFRPLEERRLPEVRGVLWLDVSDGHLRSVEYEYVHHRTLEVRGRDAHGALGFRSLPNGTWIVDEWHITLPRLAEVRDSDGRPRRYDVRGYVEEGGAVAEVRRRDGHVVARPGRPGVRGVVTDSLGRPLEGARIRVEGTGLTAVSGPEGTFRIGDLGRGVWSVRATSADLDGWGHPGVTVDAEVNDDRDAEVSARLPSLTEVTLDACRRDDRGGDIANDGEGIPLLGRVLGGDSASFGSAEVRVSWTASTDGGRALRGLGTRTRPDGTFRVCAVPVDRQLMVSVQGPDQGSATEVVVPEGAEMGAVEVRMSTGEPGSATEADEGAAGAEGPTTLPAWVDSTGFRRRAGQAMFQAGPAELAHQQPDSLTGVLAGIPRIEVRETATGRTDFRLHPSVDWSTADGVDRSCVLDIYLNGNLLRQRVGDNWELAFHRAIDPTYVSGIEVFEGRRAPVGAPESCGAILLWVERLRDEDDPAFRGSLVGRVEAEGPLPEDGVHLRLRPGDLETRAGDGGRFRIDGVPPGLYTLEAEVPGWGPASMEVEIRAGGTTDATVIVGEPD